MTTKSERLNIYEQLQQEIQLLTNDYVDDVIIALKKRNLPVEQLFDPDKLALASFQFHALVMAILEVWVRAGELQPDEELLH